MPNRFLRQLDIKRRVARGRFAQWLLVVNSVVALTVACSPPAPRALSPASYCRLSDAKLLEGGKLEIKIKIGNMVPTFDAEGHLDVLLEDVVPSDAKSDTKLTKACSMSVDVKAEAYRAVNGSMADREAVVSGATNQPCHATAPKDAYPVFNGTYRQSGGRKECIYDGDVPAALGGAATAATVHAARKLAASGPVTNNAGAPGLSVVRIDIKDALVFPNGVEHAAPNPVVVYARISPNWLADGVVTAKAKAEMLAKMYGGPAWEKGNSDGSRYVVKSFKARVLTAQEIAVPVWAGAAALTWFWDTDNNGRLETKGPAFGPRVDPVTQHLNE